MLHGVHGVGLPDALAQRDGVVALFHAVPDVVAVHAPEAALNGRDLRVAQLLALLLQLSHETGAAAGRHVAPVQEAMDIDLLEAAGLGHVEDSEDVVEMAVHAAGGEQAQDVQGFAVLLRVVHGLDVDRVLEELAGLDLLGDLGQNLEHDAAGADVGVADLGVAHLAVRKPHVEPAGLPLHEGIFLHEAVEVRGHRRFHGIALHLIRKAEAVHDHQHRRPFHSGSTTFAKSGFSEAPPTRPPSISGCSKSSFALAGATLPP